MILSLGRGGLGRPLYLGHVPNFGAWPDALDEPATPFIAVVVSDAAGVSTSEIEWFARKLLSQGAVEVCTWGTDCERVHDIFDGVIAERRPGEPFVVTTWHANEPLTEALWYAVWAVLPDETFGDLDSFPVVFVVVGETSRVCEIRTWVARGADD